MTVLKTRQGILLALGAYTIWGLAPVYFKTIAFVPADEIVTHRIIWSLVFMLLLISLSGHWAKVRQALRHNRHFKLLFLSASVIAGNWLLFIWSINNNHMLEASMGYFINPLANMILGMLFFKERFRFKQWVALVLAFIAVLVQFIQLGSVPVIGLSLAFSFAFYSVIRKKLAIDAQAGMLVETATLLPFALIYLLFFTHSNTSDLTLNSLSLNVLLSMAGVVTTIPLLLFTAAASRLPLSMLGFFQYIAPTATFLLAVFVYGETVDLYVLITFLFIWAALFFFVWDAISANKKLKKINIT